MTDRELLELAAKAAGKTGEFRFEHQSHGDCLITGINTGGRFLWNPLEDDGDSLRLSIDLQISITSNIVRYEASTISLSLAGIFIREDMIKQDPRIACRRAIVRAAAEIGKSMEKSQ